MRSDIRGLAALESDVLDGLEAADDQAPTGPSPWPGRPDAEVAGLLGGDFPAPA